MIKDTVLLNLSNLGGIPSDYEQILLEYIEQLVLNNIAVQGLLLFGSLTKRTSRPWQSDIDLLVVIDGPSFNSKERFLFKRQVAQKAYPGVQALWMTSKELEESYKGRAGHIMDALYLGWILFDPSAILDFFRKQLLAELESGKFRRVENHWVWPLERLGEEIAL